MPNSSRPLRTSLQAKVLSAVLALLVLLPAAMLWVVNRQITLQTHDDASRSLTLARAMLLQSLNNRRDSLVAAYRNVENDTRFRRVVNIGHAPTLRSILNDVLEEFGNETSVLAFVTADERWKRQDAANAIGHLFYIAGSHGPAVPQAEFARATLPLGRAALDGDLSSAIYRVDGHELLVVAVPVKIPDLKFPAVLLAGAVIDEAVLNQLKPPATELAVVADDSVLFSTLSGPDVAATLRRLPSGAGEGVREALLNDEHFLVLGGEYGREVPTQGFRFMLMSSYESQLATLRRTRLTLLGLSLAGIALSAVVVWVLVRRITAPLRALRDSAEAVGRGDFSRRIERFSNDECGELAVAFNQMTTNLQTSRAELERAMQTVKSTQEQLIQSEKLSAVGQFVAGVAHELNNPLTAVIGFSELLQSSETDEKTKGHLDRIAKSAHRCHKIVHSLLSFARQQAPERKLVALHTILEEVLEIMAYDLRTSNVTIVREFAPSVPAIMADPHQLQQVFVNILGNARQAIEPFQREGRIVIRTQARDGWVTIEFQDNGPGIRAEHLARIFDPFFTTKPAGKGTGLGLSLSYGLIQEHGGRITARSELGHGATFHIELPVAPVAGPATLRPSATPWAGPASSGPSGQRILVIDDEEWILDLAGELLRSEGHTVELASSGQRALELLALGAFDVIVSDWKMPGLNGIRLYEHLTATNPAAAKRMLFMTGDVVSDTFQSFLEQHQLACLSKPFAISEFRAAVTRMLRAVKAGSG